MKSSKKRKARRRRMLFLMTVLLGATAGAYAVCAQQYTAKFIPGTVVNGVNISDQTAEEVERDLSEKAGAYQLTLHFSDEKSETLTADSMGYRYVSDGSIGRLLSVQTAGCFPSRSLIRGSGAFSGRRRRRRRT